MAVSEILEVGGIFAIWWFAFEMISSWMERKIVKAWAAKRSMELISLRRHWFSTSPFFGLGPAYSLTVCRNGRHKTGQLRICPGFSLHKRVIVQWAFTKPKDTP